MSERKRGWYWVRPYPDDDWEVWQWAVGAARFRWWASGEEFSMDEPAVVGPRISEPQP